MTTSKPFFSSSPPFPSLYVGKRTSIYLHQSGVIIFTIYIEMLHWTLECTHPFIIPFFCFSFVFARRCLTVHCDLTDVTSISGHGRSPSHIVFLFCLVGLTGMERKPFD